MCVKGNRVEIRFHGMGKFDTAEMAGFAQAVAAARAADLSLRPQPRRPYCSRLDPTAVELIYLDDKRARLTVRLDRRSARLVRIRIDVGLFGSEVTARLFLTRLRAHLPHHFPPRPPDKEPASRPMSAATQNIGRPSPTATELRLYL